MTAQSVEAQSATSAQFQPQILANPSKVKQGDKLLIAISGFEPRRSVEIGISNVGEFPNVTTDENGHAAFTLTVPNLANNFYDIYARNTALGQSDTARIEISSLASDDYPLFMFSAWQLPEYTHEDSTALTHASLTVTNVGRVSALASVFFSSTAPTGTNPTTPFLIGTVNLSPGQAQTLTGPGFITSHNSVYYVRATINGANVITDNIKEEVIQGLAPDGEPYYLSVINPASVIGEAVIFPQPPVPSYTCPVDSHFDLQSGLCVSDNPTIPGGSDIYNWIIEAFNNPSLFPWLIILIVAAIIAAALIIRRKSKKSGRRIKIRR